MTTPADTAPPHRFSCVVARLGGDAAEHVLALGRSIPDEDLADDGRETDPHVTVLYGLHGDDPLPVAAALAGEPPARMELGRTLIFPATESRASDVIAYSVVSPDLQRLNAKLAKLPHSNDYPGYLPHATVAYVKPGLGGKYANRAFRGPGPTHTARSLTFSNREKVATEIPLAGPDRDANAPAVHLHRAGGGTVPMVDAPESDTADLPKEILGVPVFYGWKELIYPGQFLTPKGDVIDVDPARVDHWVRTFGAMAGNDVYPFVPDDHLRTTAANNGRVVRMRRNDRGALEGLLQLVGEEARRKAATNDVSVGIKPLLRDGLGNVYRDAIEHVALTPEPAVPGQDPIVQAASRASADAAAGAEPTDPAASAEAPNQRSTPMAKQLACSDETLSALHKLVPGLQDAPDDEKMSRLAQHLHALSMMDNEDAGGPAAVATLSRADIQKRAADNRKALKADAGRLSAENAKLAEQVKTLSRQVPQPLGEEATAAIVDGARTKLESVVARGALDKATADRLGSILIDGADGRGPNLLTLSRAANPTGNKSLALALLDVLADNRPVDTRELSGAQHLSRHVPDADEAGKKDENPWIRTAEEMNGKKA